MKRLIEELIEKRKKNQQKFKTTLTEIAELLEKRGTFSKKKPKLKEKILELEENLNNWMTVQDQEWDAQSNNHYTQVFNSLQWKIEKLEAEYANIKTLLANFINLEKSLQNLIDSLPAERAQEPIQKLTEIKEQLSVFQYADFEQRFRGDQQKVKEKLEKYAVFFQDTDNIIDLGCGRGEFVEILHNQGKQAEGVDISASMLKEAEKKNLKCLPKDILQFLKEKEDNSIGGIFSSQVIEHFSPEYLKEVTIESFRILRKNAPLVLETINPLSLFALSNIFFLDVTHQKPLHPEFMRYLLESTGFSGVEIRYSDELNKEKLEEINSGEPIARVFNSNVDKLNKILYSSPVYAVIGKK
jgi:O-antigen chain-terminating methyltransferase